MEILFDKTKKCDEKTLLIIILGALSALKEKCITVTEAERLIFSPYMAKQLRKYLYPENIIDIIESGCELEDVESIIPDKFEESINNLYYKTITVLKKYAEEDDEFWINIIH